MTNVLVEGGGKVLGALFDAGAVDEVQAYIAPKIVGGTNAPTAIAGLGITDMASALRLDRMEFLQLGDDLCLRGRIARQERSAE